MYFRSQWMEAGHRGHNGPSAVPDAAKANRNELECATIRCPSTAANLVRVLPCTRPNARRFVRVSPTLCLRCTDNTILYLTNARCFTSESKWKTTRERKKLKQNEKYVKSLVFIPWILVFMYAPHDKPAKMIQLLFHLLSSG